MAQYLHIRCVVRTDRTNAHERIHSVGGVKPEGSRWKLTQDKSYFIHPGWDLRCSTSRNLGGNGLT